MIKLYQASMHDKFAKPVEEYDVQNKSRLELYRALWRKWMYWYDHSPEESNSVESQIHTMLFDDLT